MESVRPSLEGYVADRLEGGYPVVAGACMARLSAVLGRQGGEGLLGAAGVLERVEAVARAFAVLFRGVDPGGPAVLLEALRGLVGSLRRAGLGLRRVLEALGVVEEVLVEAVGEALASYPAPLDPGPALAARGAGAGRAGAVGRGGGGRFGGGRVWFGGGGAEVGSGAGA